MAKSGTKPSEPTIDSDSTTLSTRFTAKQREVLEQAAVILNCSPAKLIREAALERSVDVINASGNAGTTLRSLAEKALRQLINPVVELRWPALGPGFESVIETMRMRDWDTLDTIEQQSIAESHRDEEVGSLQVKPVILDSSDAHQIHSALQTCPTEFVRMMLQQWEAVEHGGQHYQPKLSAKDLMAAEGDL